MARKQRSQDPQITVSALKCRPRWAVLLWYSSLWFKIAESKWNLSCHWEFIAAFRYLIRGKFPLVCHHPPQTGHRAEQRHSQPDPQVPLSFGAEHQNHTQRPATDKDTQVRNDGRETERPLFWFLCHFSNCSLLYGQEGTKEDFHE